MKSTSSSKMPASGNFANVFEKPETRIIGNSVTYKSLSPVEANLLHVLSNAGDAAARVLRHYFGSKLKVNIKADESPLVTIADLQAERAIRRVLEHLVPLHGILGGGIGFQKTREPLYMGIGPHRRHPRFHHRQALLRHPHRSFTGRRTDHGSDRTAHIAGALARD